MDENTPDQQRIVKLETLLTEILINLQEDIPCDRWSNHLTSSVREAYDYLAKGEYPCE